jgi:hypothetical protein
MPTPSRSARRPSARRGPEAVCPKSRRSRRAAGWGPSADVRLVTQLYGDVRRWAGACADVFSGNAGVHEPCFIDDECTSGLCSATAEQCPGTCVALPGAGEACLFSIAPNNRPISFCAAGLECAERSRICVAAGAEGTRCRRAEDCLTGLGCYLSGVCGPCPGTRYPDVCVHDFPAAGGCVVSDRLWSDDCRGRQFCAGTAQRDGTLDGTCLGPHSLGEACLPSAVTGCGLPLVCDPVSSTCAEPPRIGSPCFDFCATGGYCEDEVHVCAPQKANGETCRRSSECRGGACDGGVCAMPTPLAACHRP